MKTCSSRYLKEPLVHLFVARWEAAACSNSVRMLVFSLNLTPLLDCWDLVELLTAPTLIYKALSCLSTSEIGLLTQTSDHLSKTLAIILCDILFSVFTGCTHNHVCLCVLNEPYGCASA